METVLKAIADWIKGILTAGIMSNLSGLFDDVNTQVGNIAQQVGTKAAVILCAVPVSPPEDSPLQDQQLLCTAYEGRHDP